MTTLQSLRLSQNLAARFKRRLRKPPVRVKSPVVRSLTVLSPMARTLRLPRLPLASGLMRRHPTRPRRK